MKLIGISGSLRRASFNTALLRYAAGLLPEGVELDVQTLHGIPLYDGDIETSAGIPASVETLKNLIINADGLILCTPEYNNSIPGVFKNAIDWLSRPPARISPVFNGKPVAILGATPGQYGTMLGQNAWLPVLRAVGAKPWYGGRLMVAKAEASFGASGAITDEALKRQLSQFVHGFVEFIRPPSGK
ncbi:MAG: NADPH-dependent FMN reductase [Alphaproteobacteria bacterium]